MIDAVTATTRVARDVRETAWAYVRLTKPRIVALLVITTIPAMVLAEGGMPSVWLILATVLGGSVVAGGANAMNMYFDRDIDELMVRTRGRPVPAGQVEPEKAAVFGIVMAAGGFVFMEFTVNLLAALLTLGAFAFYVVVYTLWLKRTTPLNIVIGGAAGAMPPVIGWAAVTGGVSMAAVLLFAIVTLWTPPHFWALAIHRCDDYRRAGVPMLPVTHGVAFTARRILQYTLVLLAVSLLPVAIGMSGRLYLAGASALGLVFIGYAWRLRQDRRWAMPTFRYSIVYLTLLFVLLLVDRYVVLPQP